MFRGLLGNILGIMSDFQEEKFSHAIKDLEHSSNLSLTLFVFTIMCSHVAIETFLCSHIVCSSFLKVS